MSSNWLSNILSPAWATPPKARVELYTDKNQCLLGEQITGKIKLVSDEEFVVNQETIT
jgi:hypothetical protein